MKRTIIVRTAFVAVLLTALAVCPFGFGRTLTSVLQPTGAAHAEPATPAILYWKSPDGTNEFSPGPKKTADGRDFLPVYETDEKAIGQASPPLKLKSVGKIIYYRHPMGLPDVSKVPKKDSMGMDYIPVYESQEGGSAVKVSLDRVQRSGVRTEVARMEKLAQPVHAAGVAKPDERTLRSVTLRADGFIEKLYVNETGAHVTAGEPMFSVYSPQMVQVQVDYWGATHAAGGDVTGAIRRLRNFAVPESLIDRLRTAPAPIMQIDWPAPITGVVMEKKVVVGQMMKAGEELFRLADLTSIWVIASVAEQDISFVKVGTKARMTFRAYPGEVYEGRVTFILHELDMATRTAKVRIEVANPEHRIKHEMYAEVEIDAGSDTKRLIVPVSAVIDSGNKQVVIVDRGEGLFEPRAVTLGLRSESFVEILDGLRAGESVVVTANFLIDAESNLKAALQSFTTDGTP